MRSDEELSDLLHAAAMTIGDDVQADPRGLMSRARHRRQMVGLALAAAVALLAVAAVPSLVHRDAAVIDIAAGGVGGANGPDPQAPEPSTALEEPSTTMAPTPADPPVSSADPTVPSLPAPTAAPPAPAPPRTTVPRPPTTPSTPVTRAPAVAPELVSASGNAAAGRLLLRFTRPVVPGDGPGLGATTPTSQDMYLTAMQLVVFSGDSACSTPAGNAHQYLAGVGTDTLTVEASSLVVGTTYISVNPGFAKSAASDGTAMAGVRCVPITVKG